MDFTLCMNAAVQHVRCSFNYQCDNFAHVAQSNMRRCDDVCSDQPQNGASCRSFLQWAAKASASDDDGVIGYQAQTVAPP